MIAPAVSLEGIQDQFVALLPELSNRLSVRFRYRNPEARAEAVAEGIGLAWAIFLSARKKDKDITASNLAYYAGRSVEAGRKLAGTATCDALSDTTVSRQRIGKHVSLGDIGEGSTGFCRVFGDRRWKWDVLDYVAPALDLQIFLAHCSARDRKILKMKAAGHQQCQIAARLGVSPPAVHQRLRRLESRWMADTAA
jgi:hypothetical protein